MSDVEIKQVTRKVEEVRKYVKEIDSGVDKVADRLERVERRTSGLGGQIESVGEAVSTAQTTITRTIRTALSTEISTAVSTLGQQQQATHTEVAELRAEVVGHLERSELAQHKQSAQEELAVVRQRLESQFAAHARVRDRAIRLLQAMDARRVPEPAVRDLHEHLVGAPGYWLASALVALGAWLRGDRSAVQAAVAEALARDEHRAALFFVLVLQRHGREQGVAPWVERYLESQDPLDLAPEFRIVLDAATTGAFDAATNARVVDTVARWVEELAALPHLAEIQERRWSARLGAWRTTPPELPALERCAADQDALADLASAAGAFAGGLQFLESVTSSPAYPAEALRSRAGVVLTRLTSDPDPAEASLRRRAERLEAVIEFDGDRVAADAATVMVATGSPSGDLLRLLADAALGGGAAVDVPTPTRRLAVVLLRPRFAAAVDQLEDRLARAHPSGVPLEHGSWTGVLHETTSEEALVRDVGEHHREEAVATAAAIRPHPRAWAAGLVAGVGTVLGIVWLVQGHVAPGGVALAVALVALVFVATELHGVTAGKKQARKQGECSAIEGEQAVRGAVADAQVWLGDFEAAMAEAAGLRRKLLELEP